MIVTPFILAGLVLGVAAGLAIVTLLFGISTTAELEDV